MAYENVTLRVDSSIADIIRSKGLSIQDAFDKFCSEIKSGEYFSDTNVKRPKALDDMTESEIEEMLEASYQQALRGEGRPAADVFDELLRGLA